MLLKINDKEGRLSTVLKKDVKNAVRSHFLLKTKKIAMVRSHFLGSKPFLGGSSVPLCYWKQISRLLSKGRACGSKPFLRFKAISGESDVGIGIWGGRLVRNDSDDVIPSLRSELALSPFASLRACPEPAEGVNSAKGAGSERSEGSRVSPRPAKKIGLSSTREAESIAVEAQFLK